MPGEQNTPRTWREITAELVRDVFSPKMLWALIGAAGLSLCFIIFDAVFRNGCVNFGFFQSSACNQFVNQPITAEQLKAAFLSDITAIQKIKGDKGDAGENGSSAVPVEINAVAAKLIDDNQFISKIARSPEFAQYTAKALIGHHRDQLIPETPSVDQLKSALLTDPAAVSVLKGEAGEQGPAGSNEEIPSDAVVAFNSSLSEVCPEGWSPFRPAISRIIVGAGHPSDEDISPVLTARLSYVEDRSRGKTSAMGGEEKVKLTELEMPRHDHGSIWGGVATQRQMSEGNNFHTSGHVQIKFSGGSKPHNNMPPYIALYYCIKKN